MNDEKRKVIEAQTVEVLKELKECLWFKNYQQRNIFTTNRGSNEKPALKLAVTKFQKRSSQIIFPKTYLFRNTVSFKKSCGEIKFQ